MQNAVNCVLNENAFVLYCVLAHRCSCATSLLWRVMNHLSCAALLLGEHTTCCVALECEGARVTMSAIVWRSNSCELRDLTLTGLDDWLRWTNTIFACRVQDRLAALLLMLMQWVEGYCSRAGASRGGWHSAERCGVELCEVAVVVVHFDARCFRSMLRYIRHLLLFCQHLNLHLLLLRKRHEIVEHVSATIAVMRRHIFVLVTIFKVELGTIS